MARTIATSCRPEPGSAEARETDDIIGSYDSDNDRRGEDNPGDENPGGDGDLWRRWRTSNRTRIGGQVLARLRILWKPDVKRSWR
eukprot:scaffold642_cov73-Cylindrotheca_fusiformis.AAC.2